MTQKELKTLLCIQVQNALTHLVKANLLQRRSSTDQVFIYLSPDDSIAKAQWQKRLEFNKNESSMKLPSETIIIDIFVRNYSRP